MKRISIAVAICLVLLILIPSLLLQRRDPEAPRFVPGQVKLAGLAKEVRYSWADLVPFAGGKLWLWTSSGTNGSHCLLYDLDRRVVIGELLNGGPVFCNRDQTRLLCAGHVSLETSMKQKVMAFCAKVFRGKVRKVNRAEAFWLLDLRDNSVQRLGELSQLPGTGSRWRPSPGFRYGCNVPNNAEEGSSFFLCDLQTGLFEKIKLHGDVQGWWDENQILVRDPEGNFILFDVAARKSSSLFSSEMIAGCLGELALTNVPGRIRAINSWNGRDYDFFFALQSESYNAGESFLLKANHVDPSLKLLYRNFKFEHLGRFDASATLYLYNGESGLPGRGGNGGVFLRDLSNNTCRALVPPDNSGQYALARFYGDEVIYYRGRFPWRMRLDGSNNVPLFPQ